MVCHFYFSIEALGILNLFDSALYNQNKRPNQIIFKNQTQLQKTLNKNRVNLIAMKLKNKENTCDRHKQLNSPQFFHYPIHFFWQISSFFP